MQEVADMNGRRAAKTRVVPRIILQSLAIFKRIPATELKWPNTKLKGVVWYGLKNATDLWQQVDAGYAQLVKLLVTQP